MISFHKNRECPTSQELLEFQNTANKTTVWRKINDHLCSCDFCGAEAEFYSHFPQKSESKISTTQIPDHLFELAVALLNNKDKGNSILKNLLKSNERFAV